MAKKKTRARAPEKKAEQFEEILSIGREMFVKYGTHGFSMRALARELGMSQPNLYNYVSSKRELWIAIRTKYFKELNDGIRVILKDKKQSYIDIFVRLSEYFLEFAGADYKRFSMMFLISAPRSKKEGPLEKNYRPFSLIQVLLDVLLSALRAAGVPDEDKSWTNLLYHVFGILLGAAMTEGDLKLRHKITEPIVGDYYDLTPQEYRKFVLKEIRERLEATPLADI